VRGVPLRPTFRAVLAHGVDVGTVGLWTYALDRQPWARAAEVVAEIEEQGWGCLWIPEATNRGPFVHAALLLGATRTLRVATGVAAIQARDALAMACEQHTLSEAFPGRFLLGLGVSHAWLVQELRHSTWRPPLAAMREYLDALDAAPSSAYTPPAWVDGPRLPRVLAALGPKMLALAAERADGAHPYLTVPEHTASARAVLGPDRLLAPEVKVVLTSDTAVGRAVGRRELGNYLGQPNYARNLLRQGFTEDDLADGGSDRLVDAIVVHGDVDVVARRVGEHHAAGADHVALQVLTPEVGEVPMAQWRELAPALVPT
jgi:probable F420-dependent oxidoreductase